MLLSFHKESKTKLIANMLSVHQAQTNVQLKIRHWLVRVAGTKVHSLTFIEAGAAGGSLLLSFHKESKTKLIANMLSVHQAQTNVQLKIRHWLVRVAGTKVHSLTFIEAGAAGGSLLLSFHKESKTKLIANMLSVHQKH